MLGEHFSLDSPPLHCGRCMPIVKLLQKGIRMRAIITFMDTSSGAPARVSAYGLQNCYEKLYLDVIEYFVCDTHREYFHSKRDYVEYLTAILGWFFTWYKEEVDAGLIVKPLPITYEATSEKVAHPIFRNFTVTWQICE